MKCKHWVYVAMALIVAFMVWAMLALFADAQVQQIPPVSGGGGTPGDDAPLTAQYWLGTADAQLLAAKNLGALASGLVLNTGGTPTAYGGASCANQALTALNASGAATCASVTSAFVTDGTLTDADVAAANKDGVAATASLRTLGTGAQQAAAGNDARLPTTGEKSALAGTSGTPGASNQYVTSEDPRLPSSITPGGLSAASQITCSRQTILVASTGGAVTLTDPNWLAPGVAGQECRVCGTSDTNTLQAPNTANVILAGNSGSVLFSLSRPCVEFVHTGTVWRQANIISWPQGVAVNPVASMGACGAATNPVIDGGSGNKIEFCLTGTTPTVRMLCGGSDCTSTAIVNPRFAFSGAKPTCDATLAGSDFPYWGTRAGGAKDKMEICAKLANDTYAWSEVIN